MFIAQKDPNISLIKVPIKSLQFMKWELFLKFYEPFFADF